MKRLVLFALLLTPSAALAQESDISFFVSGGAAYGFAGDTDGRTFAGAPLETRYDEVIAFGVGAGAVIDSRFEIGAEFFYAGTQIDGMTTGGVTFPIDSDITTFGGMMNAYYRHPLDFGVTPYIGGAFGFASVSVEEDRATAAGANFFVPDQEEVVPAAAVDVGFDYALNETVSVGPRYRYLWIDRDNFSTNLFSARARYDF